jgi:hypothetical protein
MMMTITSWQELQYMYHIIDRVQLYIQM